MSSKLKPRADGRYVCKYKGKCFYGRTEPEAKESRKAYIKAEQSGKLLARELTVKEYAQKWLPLYKSSVSEKCYNDYAKQIEGLEEEIPAHILGTEEVLCEKQIGRSERE